MLLGIRPALGAMASAIVVTLLIPAPSALARMSRRTINLALGFASDNDADYFVRDMDGDGKADVVRVNCDKSGQIAIGFSLGAGKGLKPKSVTGGWDDRQGFHPYTVWSGVCLPGETVDIADLDGDGAGDLLIQSYDPLGPGQGGGKLEARLGVVDKIEDNSAADGFSYADPYRKDPAWRHVRPHNGGWRYKHRGFSARFTLIPQLPNDPALPAQVIRHGDVSCDGRPDLVRFDLYTGDVLVYRDQSTGSGPGCGFTGAFNPGAAAQCSFDPSGQLWLSDFAYDDDVPFVGSIAPTYGGSARAGIVNMSRSDDKVYMTSSDCNSFAPPGAAPSGYPAPSYGDTSRSDLAHEGKRFVKDATHLFVADMNRDGYDDIVSFDKDAQGRRNMWVALNDQSWGFGTWGGAPYFPILWMSEAPNHNAMDLRERQLDLGDVDGDGYLDYVMFPNISIYADAQVRFQLVNYLAVFESSTLRDPATHGYVPDSYQAEWWHTSYVPKLTHDYPYFGGRYQGQGVKYVVDPFISFDDAGIGGSAYPHANRPGAAFHLYDFIPGHGSCSSSTGIKQGWDDRLGLSELELDAMYTCGVSSTYGLTPKQFADSSKHEQEQRGIYHHSHQAMIATTREDGDCDGGIESWWYVGRMFRSADRNHYEGREAFAQFMHSTRHCSEETEVDAKVVAHEYGHALNLLHDEAYQQYRPYTAVIPELEWWFQRPIKSTNSTNMKSGSFDENEYSFWYSPISAFHLAGQKPDISTGALVCEDQDVHVNGTYFTGHHDAPTFTWQYVCVPTPAGGGTSCKQADKYYRRVHRHREKWQRFWK